MFLTKMSVWVESSAYKGRTDIFYTVLFAVGRYRLSSGSSHGAAQVAKIPLFVAVEGSNVLKFPF